MLDPDRSLKDQLTDHGIRVEACLESRHDSWRYRSLWAADGRYLGDFTVEQVTRDFDSIVTSATPPAA